MSLELPSGSIAAIVERWVADGYGFAKAGQTTYFLHASCRKVIQDGRFVKPDPDNPPPAVGSRVAIIPAKVTKTGQATRARSWLSLE